jgi:hypothetical protein
MLLVPFAVHVAGLRPGAGKAAAEHLADVLMVVGICS